MTEVPDGSDPVALANWLFDLARQGDAARLAAYVDAGAPVDLTDADGNTLLMLAAYHDHPETVAELARRGADVERQVLSRAVLWHAQDRVIRHGNHTIVF